MDKVKMEVPFFQSPNGIFDVGLSAHELAVYLYLARLGNNGGKAFPSYQTIADKAGMSRSKAMACVKELERRKLIFKKVRKTSKALNQTNIYNVQHDMTKILTGVPETPRSTSQLPNKELQEKEKELNNKTSRSKSLLFLNESHYLFMKIYGEMYEQLTNGFRHPRITHKQMETVTKRISHQVGRYSLKEGSFRIAVLDYWRRFVETGEQDGNINGFAKTMEAVLVPESDEEDN